MTDNTLREEVRRHYARAALAVMEPAGCCTPGSAAVGDPVFGRGLYEPAQLDPLPPDAVSASLGCGNPTAMADLRPGETVLDLGSGGGIDVLLSAARVAPTGVAYGLDMTDEMLELARRNAAAAGAANARFLKGEIEAIPLPDASVDVVISNCVINLSTDKARVFAEIARVLRPGGRMSVSDVVADDSLSPADRAARGDHAGCIAGALSFGEYAEGLAAAGLDRLELEPTHRAVDGMYNVIIRARRPAAMGDDASLAPGDAAGVASSALATARSLPRDGTVPLGAAGRRVLLRFGDAAADERRADVPCRRSSRRPRPTQRTSSRWWRRRACRSLGCASASRRGRPWCAVNGTAASSGWRPRNATARWRCCAPWPSTAPPGVAAWGERSWNGRWPTPPPPGRARPGCSPRRPSRSSPASAGNARSGPPRPADVAASVEFAHACPTTAVAMRRAL